jgi:hypothetical protein
MENVRPIEKIINIINPEVNVLQALDFSSDASSETILLGERFEEDFREVIQKVYDRIGIVLPCSHETFAILHELGHIETLNKYDEDTIEELTQSYMKEKNDICEDDDGVERFYNYTQLEIEQLANDWAIDFMQANPLIVAKLDRTVKDYYDNLDEGDLFHSLIISKLLETL